MPVKWILVLDIVTDPLSFAVIDEKCLSVSIPVFDPVVIIDLVPLAVTDKNSNSIYLLVVVDYINCDSVGVDELIVVCDAVPVPISFGVELGTAIVVREPESFHFDIPIAISVHVGVGVSE
jgi:hypothetical protein